ncbi:MAG: Hsp20/alpha crystallin family protein [Halobacteria archaeon]|nr:Hsp20/alpha crystallin family protein [Halobacteria archaeon]
MTRKWEPFGDLDRLLRELRENIRSEMDTDLPRPPGMKKAPVDVINHPDRVVVLADLPGFEKADIRIEANEDNLTIKADRIEEVGREEADYYRRERSHKSVNRTVSLPAEVKTDEAKATFENGVLEVTLPKVEVEEGTRIDIE